MMLYLLHEPLPLVVMDLLHLQDKVMCNVLKQFRSKVLELYKYYIYKVPELYRHS